MVVALVPIVAFGILLSAVTVPFVALGPGPTFDTLGEVDGKEVVDIKGTQVHPTAGHLNMTTVSQSDGITLGQALALWMSGRDQLVPRDLVYPPDKSKDEIDEENNSDFQRSEDNAEYAALSYLKYPMAVTVENVTDPGPSAGKLQDGDAIDYVNNKPVANLDEFTALLKTTKPGDQLVIDYRRKGRRRRAPRRSPLARTRTATTASSASPCSTRRGRTSPSTSTWPTSADRPRA